MSDALLHHYRKPEGEAGREVIERMYTGHAAMTRAFVELLRPGADDVVLDIGCGGGLALSLMAERGAHADGIDYSDTSVEKALEYNRDAVQDGRVTVRRAAVLDMPFADGTYTLATAIETVYFWERLEDCYARIHAVLRPGGRFALVCDSWRDGERIVNEPDRMDILRLNLYSPDQFVDALTRAGFASVETREIGDERSLCVVARKG